MPSKVRSSWYWPKKARWIIPGKVWVGKSRPDHAMKVTLGQARAGWGMPGKAGEGWIMLGKAKEG